MRDVVEDVSECLLQNVCCVLLILTASFCLASCDNSFQPLKENDQYFFSIQGYLDASADTQWVRLSPVREEYEQPVRSPEMDVTLEQLETSTKTAMHRLLLTDEDGFNRSMVWTDMEILAGQTYLLSVESPDGSGSHVTVTIPEDFPTPVMREEARFGRPSAYNLLISGAGRLADLQTRWHVRNRSTGADRYILFPYRGKEIPTSNGYRLFLDPVIEMNHIRDLYSGDASAYEVIDRQVYVAAAGPEWNEEIDSLNDLLYTLPDGWSNIEDGLGYMVGIVSKSIPYDSCLDESGEPAPCLEVTPFVR
ncbi:MAG: hypothetical protein WD355_02110 [Balneolaceae bacterium]